MLVEIVLITEFSLLKCAFSMRVLCDGVSFSPTPRQGGMTEACGERRCGADGVGTTPALQLLP
jgi:hypothetical protein